MTPYLTPHQLRNLRAAERRTTAVEAMDPITATYPDLRKGPPRAAASRSWLAHQLDPDPRKET